MASRTGVDELEDDEDGLEGADDGDDGAEILDGVLALEPPEASLDGLADLRSVESDLFACDPADDLPAFGDGCLLGLAGAAGADPRPAIGDGCLLGVAGAVLRLTAASS